MVKGKRGWLRIAEAVIALLIMAIVVLTFRSSERVSDSRDFSSELRTLLDEAGSNEDLRDKIILGDPNAEKDTADFLDSRINKEFFNYTVKICELSSDCDYIIEADEIYIDERIISANSDAYNPMRVRIFLWRIG